jgi:hypothetical protein
MSDIQPDGHIPGRFPTTEWSRVVTAGSRDAPEAREALSGLCQSYWYPICAYNRHGGYPHTANTAYPLQIAGLVDLPSRRVGPASPDRG